MARILVAEDDPGVRLLVTRALMMEGHAVVAAEDGEAALELLEEKEGAFDLLLSDIRMPVMTGIELARAVSTRFPALTILLMTGYAEQREEAETLPAIVGIVDKPFTVAEIRRAVTTALAGSYTEWETVRSCCA
ncbi:response regulator [Consotaella salsifontis]|uniref:Response regulator receiver domain-containing protein n=1 Tax=Consotaella salsifontis TaxID=1365950 RepID=A0A1T4RRD0_9HYPH|nr:response regulator [Consotaella salsifontis]SKA18540.1 Response regulator receiver domain-containing protein [Consotaella salsifontis]